MNYTDAFDLRKLCQHVKNHPDDYRNSPYRFAEIIEELLAQLDEVKLQRDQAIAALKKAKKALKKTLKMFQPEVEHKPEDCRYYVDQWFHGIQGRCIGTMEMDPCKGENCPNWKPKEENK